MNPNKKAKYTHVIMRRYVGENDKSVWGWEHGRKWYKYGNYRSLKGAEDSKRAADSQPWAKDFEYKIKEIS